MDNYRRWSGVLVGVVVLVLLVLLEIQIVRKIGGECFINQARLKDNAQAFLHDMRRALSLDSSNGFGHFLLSRYYVKTRDYDKALEEVLIARNSFSSFNGLLQIGSIYLKMHNYNKAMETFRQAHLIVPGNTVAQNYMAFSLLRMKDLDQARQALSDVLERECLNASSLYLMGVASDISGQRRLGRYYHYWAFLQQQPKERNPFYNHEYIIRRIQAVD